MTSTFSPNRPSDVCEEVGPRNPWRVLALLVLILLAYGPSYRGENLWDDDYLIFRNPYLQANNALETIWLTTRLPDYYPVTSTLFWVELQLFGDNPFGYHVVAIALHAANALLLWRVLAQLNIPGAYLAALLFGLHPVCVASVGWISETKNTLSMVFYLASLLTFLQSEKSRSSKTYFASLILFVLAMLSKVSVAMLPVVLLLLAWWQRSRIAKSDLLRTIPFFFVALVLGLVAVYFQHTNAIQGGNPRPEGMLTRVLGVGWVSWFYLIKDLLPIRLAMVYPRWQIDVANAWHWLPLLGLLLALGVAWAYRKGWGRHLLLALGYFLVSLFPVSGLIAMSYHNHSLVSDHLQYVALMAPIVLVVAALSSWLARFRLSPRLLQGVAAAVLATSFLLTFQQSRQFASSTALWQQSLALNENSYAAQINYGCALAAKGRIGDAIPYLENGIRLQPNIPHLRRQAASLMMIANRPNDAAHHYQQAIELYPKDASSQYNLGLALEATGDLAAAEAALHKAIELLPNYSRAYNNLGRLRVLKGDTKDAMAKFRQAVKDDPLLPEAHYNIARLLHRQGDLAGAVLEYREAVRLRDDYAAAHNNLAWLLAAGDDQTLRDTSLAIFHARKACDATNRTNPLMLDTLATAYAAAGRLKEAQVSINKALELAKRMNQKTLVAELENHAASFQAQRADAPE
ncbi:MAG: tetratricopeptide repeat protein [Planctomycetales bacterium]|nr:tetratricopeptide repeat protein [Planctomycetales bacterium]